MAASIGNGAVSFFASGTVDFVAQALLPVLKRPS
jgi:hypothetical protein